MRIAAWCDGFAGQPFGSTAGPRLTRPSRRLSPNGAHGHPSRDGSGTGLAGLNSDGYARYAVVGAGLTPVGSGVRPAVLGPRRHPPGGCTPRGYVGSRLDAQFVFQHLFFGSRWRKGTKPPAPLGRFSKSGLAENFGEWSARSLKLSNSTVAPSNGDAAVFYWSIIGNLTAVQDAVHTTPCGPQGLTGQDQSFSGAVVQKRTSATSDCYWRRVARMQWNHVAELELRFD